MASTLHSACAVIATWPFSKVGVFTAAERLRDGGSALDAVATGIEAVELDSTVTSVGYGGLPNSSGSLQLDAALMTSSGQTGAVMALSGFPTAISTARQVLEHSPHPLLTGIAASSYARKFESPRETALLTPHARARYNEFLRGQRSAELHTSTQGSMPHSDTVGMIARDASGSLVAGCATSGMQYKLDGRVGDSPIVGAGLYADTCAAAVASGDGDKMLRFCLSFLIVERVRMGDSVAQACRFGVSRVRGSDPTCQAAVVAMDASGNCAAACTHDGFCIVKWTDGHGGGRDEVCVEQVAGAQNERWHHSCV